MLSIALATWQSSTDTIFTPFLSSERTTKNLESSENWYSLLGSSLTFTWSSCKFNDTFPNFFPRSRLTIYNSSIYSCLSSEVAYFSPLNEQKHAKYLMFGENLSEVTEY